ncbi:MAG TPA: App1 family protein, partial [Salinimicrobium sp.]|nr:App1 family protein [Salinimicrobium sp.]
IGNAEVILNFKKIEVRTRTMKDGYFRFSIPFNEYLDSGWHSYVVSCEWNGMAIVEKGELLKPYKGKLGIISDIDDTFLISHTKNIFKKIYVLLSRNINRRKIYDDVVPHYKALSISGQENGGFNSFFYVSSSEWNLYEFITRFAFLHELPKAIVKLKKLKTGIQDFLFSGRGSHDHKFQKIKDIISFYPKLEYVLLGDDSQQDPFLYERIVKIYPMNIKAIYIRQISKSKKTDVVEVLKNSEEMGVATCYFTNSLDAIEHSKRIGIVK